MASRDVTYMFFQRDQDDSGGGFEVDGSPSFHSARVIRHGGGSRAGSVPPSSLRAGSVPPRSLRAGSVAPRGAVVIATATPRPSPGGIKIPSVSTTSVRHVIHRPPVQGAGGSRNILTARGVMAGRKATHDDEDDEELAATGGSRTDRGIPNFKRSSITVSTATPVEHQQRSRASRNLLIYRADDFLSGNRPGPSTPLSTDRFQSPSTFRSASTSEPSFRRRASVSGYLPSDRSTSGYSKAFPRSSDENSKSTYQLNVSVNGTVETPTKKTTAPDDSFVISPLESVSSLRSRMNLAREQMSQHRVLLDRYLPINLGPSNDVKHEVESKVHELSYRMPQLDPTKRALRSFDSQTEAKPVTLITPYKPLAKTTKVDVAPLPPLRSSFTPKISDVRKRARNVLCKVKGDPRYFDF